MKKFKNLFEEKKMKGEDPCWTGYEMVGMKDKNGKKVPNCVPVSEAKDEQEYGYEGDMALNQLATLTRCAEMIKDMLKPDTDMPEWVQSKITLATDYIQTAADYMYSEMKEEVKDEYARKVDRYLKKKYQKEDVEQIDELSNKTLGQYADKARTDIQKTLPKLHTDAGAAGRIEKRVSGLAASSVAKVKNNMKKEEVENLEEGRPSQRHPLEGHEYHKKSDEALIHIAKDAHAAAEAMKGHNTDAENKYRDQANDSATVRHFRKTSGTPDWYKKKYGHMKEEVEQIEELSNDMLGRYKKAAGADASKADKAGDYAKGNKRFSGIVKATKKQFDNDMKKEDTTPPFDGPYTKDKGTVTDKSGAKHTPMSRARDLARAALKRVKDNPSEYLKARNNGSSTANARARANAARLTESRKAEIIKDASKSAKEKAAKTKDKFEADPILSSEIVKEDK
jgi:hypothetical protein